MPMLRKHITIYNVLVYLAFPLTFLVAAFFLIYSLNVGKSDPMVFATILMGIATIWVITWQGSLIKRQLAFSTYLDLDKEWNSQG